MIVTHPVNQIPIMAAQQLIHGKSGVSLFSGRINNYLTQPLETWITSVDSAIASKGITNETLELNEAKSYFDYNKGDISSYLRCRAHDKIKTWQELKVYLRLA